VPEPDEDREPHSLDDWLAGFTRNPALQPVLLVVLGCFAAIGAGALLLAIRSRSLAAIAALALLALGTADVLQRDLRRGRFGPAARLALAFWALSALAAAAAARLGIA
jgi:hypothetical protein